MAGGLAPTVPSGDSFFTGAFRNGDISAAVQLLDVFGDSRVLSSPRISALNNQAAILRVVDQEVYFNIEVNDTVNEETGQLTGREYTIEENTVDVGFVMNVLPQISASDEIILNLKPAVTRVLEYRSAPVPAPWAVCPAVFRILFRLPAFASLIPLFHCETARLPFLEDYWKTEPVTTIARFPVLVSCPVLELCLKTLTKELIRPNLLFLSKRV